MSDLALVAPATSSHQIARGTVRVLTASMVVALAARVAFPLPFTPVPFTLQPLAVLGVGLALGPVEGFVAMVAYLLEGASGLPVFSPTGPGGIPQLLGPTGGFLMAYPLVAFLCGGITSRLAGRFSLYFAALFGCIAATALLFLCGATWLMHELHLSISRVWLAGVAPFLPGELVKCLAAAGVYRALKTTSFRAS